MFTRCSYCEAEIYHHGQFINIWDYFEHTQVIIDPQMINDMLNFLRTKHKLYPLTGHVRFFTNDGVVEYTVRNAYLV
jgi:hypothetical protein